MRTSCCSPSLDPGALTYEPAAQGLLSAREAVAAYYAEKGSQVSAEDLILTTSTSEAYSFVFRLLCNPGDAVLVPAPSYPLFDFLADLNDVKLVSYELVYDHGWQIDFESLRVAMRRTQADGSCCHAVLVVHPNNPTGSLCEISRSCRTESYLRRTTRWPSSRMRSFSTTRWELKSHRLSRATPQL